MPVGSAVVRSRAQGRPSVVMVGSAWVVVVPVAAAAACAIVSAEVEVEMEEAVSLS